LSCYLTITIYPGLCQFKYTQGFSLVAGIGLPRPVTPAHRHQCQQSKSCMLAVSLGSTPVMGPPSFVGPAVSDRTQIEFHCDVATNETDQRARFSVSFTFDSRVDPEVPAIVVNLTHRRATLHERYLAGRLHKAVKRDSIYHASLIL